jgi:hypothetical protein
MTGAPVPGVQTGRRLGPLRQLAALPRERVRGPAGGLLGGKDPAGRVSFDRSCWTA